MPSVSHQIFALWVLPVKLMKGRWPSQNRASGGRSNHRAKPSRARLAVAPGKLARAARAGGPPWAAAEAEDALSHPDPPRGQGGGWGAQTSRNQGLLVKRGLS